MNARLAGMFALLLLLPVALSAQALKCPPLPAGATCSYYHYHSRVWMVNTRTTEDLVSERDFVSAEACERARSEAMKKSSGLAEYIKLNKIDKAFQSDTFGECHCDRTDEESGPVALDARRRSVIARRGLEARWLIRDLLLDSDKDSGSDVMRGLFAGEKSQDSFLYQKFPAPVPDDRAEARLVTLVETGIGGRQQPLVVAAAATLLDVPQPVRLAPPSPVAVTTQTPPPAPPQGSPPQAAVPATGVEQPVGGPAFFEYEIARITVILKAAESMEQGPDRDAVVKSCSERRQVLKNLASLAEAAPASSPLVGTLKHVVSEADRLKLVGTLFGHEAQSVWMPTDARDLVRQEQQRPSDPLYVLTTAATNGARQAALYAVLARDGELSSSAGVSALRAIESLLVMGEGQ